MAEYIERDDVLEKIESGAMWVRSFGELYEAVQDMTPADVAPVRHGRWICKYDPTFGLTDITCSKCRDTRSIEGCYESVNGEPLWDQENYCPNCGAKMDLEVSHA